jgi:dTDP-4-dehydrorhamnose reductase
VTRILVTGASGLLGAELVLTAAQGNELIAVTNRHPVSPPPGVVALTADLTQPSEAAQVVGDYRPAWVINAAAATEVDALESQPERADKTNRVLPTNLALACRAAGAGFVHVSTDAIFDGRATRPYREDDPPGPQNVYAASKLAGEQHVRAAAPGALIVRTAIYGWNAQPKLSLAEWFLSRLEAGDDPPGFVDAWFTPINTAHVAELLLDLLARHAPAGIYHLPGAECLTKHDFGRRVAAAFGHDPARIRPARQVEVPGRARRGARSCLDGAKVAAALGRALPTVTDGLARLMADQDNGRRDALRRMGGQT